MAKYKYRQLAAKLENLIRKQTLPTGSKLPTEDELAEEHQVSRNTVRQAVQTLSDKGYLVKIQGSGTFVAAPPETEHAGKKTPRSNHEKNRCIGVVMNQVNHYIFPKVLIGINDYLLKHDYHINLRMTFNEIEHEADALAEMLAAGVAGLILEPARSALPPANRHLYQRIRESCPCVLMHASLPEFGFSSVDNSNVDGFSLAVDYLVERGHRQIALLSKSDEQSGDGRFLGYATGLRKNGIRLAERRILWYTDEDLDDIFSDANAHRVLAAINDCTAALCFNDELACRFLGFLERKNIRVPEDLSIIGFDDMQQGTKTNPLTTILHPKEEMGRVAAKTILGLINNPTANISHKFPPRLVERNSVLRLE